MENIIPREVGHQSKYGKNLTKESKVELIGKKDCEGLIRIPLANQSNEIYLLRINLGILTREGFMCRILDLLTLLERRTS